MEKTKELDENKANTNNIENINDKLEIEILNIKLGNLKNKILHNSKSFCKIIFKRINNLDLKEIKSKIIKLEENLKELNNCLFIFSNVNYDEDIFEISIEEIAEIPTESNKTLTSARINFNRLNRNKKQFEVWNLGSEDSLSVNYKFINQTDIGALTKEIVISQANKYDTNDSKEKIIPIPILDEAENKVSPKVMRNPCPIYPKKPVSLFKEIQEKNNLKEKLNHNILRHANTESNSQNVNNNNSSQQININANNFINLDFEEINQIDQYYKDTFCEGIFVAGLNKKAKIIKDSDDLRAPCKHNICSKLPAYKPEILNKFLMSENANLSSKQFLLSKFELHSATASLVYPHGIKLCYHQKEQEIKPITNYLTMTTNENGRRHYIMNFHYYKKTPLNELKSTYDIDPITDYNNYSKEVQFLIEKLTMAETLSKKDLQKYENTYAENHEMCCDLISRDYVYVPTCVCLVSKLPLADTLEKSLEVLVKMTVDENITTEEINKFIMHLIYEIPIPPINKRLFFYIPYRLNTMELKGRIFKDLPISQNIKILLNFFTAEMIVTIHHLMLQESRILFIYDNYSDLSSISFAFISLLYPMQWINTYIPIVSEEMLRYVKSFMPFIMGIDTHLFNLFLKTDEFDEESKVYLIFVNSENKKSHIETSNKSFISNYKNNKIKKSCVKEIIKTFPPMPNEVLKDHIDELEEFLNYLQKGTKKKPAILDISNSNYTISSYDALSMKRLSDDKIDKKIRSIFIRKMVLLFGDYKKYVSFIDDSNYFNSQSFLQSRDEKFYEFYNEIINSGIFRYFLNGKQDNYLYFDKMCLRYVNLILHKSKSQKQPRKESFLRNLMNSDTKTKKFSFPVFSNNNSVNEKKTDNSTSLSPSKILKKTNEIFTTSNNKTPEKKSIINLERFGHSYSNEINSDSQSIEKSMEVLEIYLVPPYFVNNSIKSVLTYEEIITEKFKKREFMNSSRIILNKDQKNFNFEKMPLKFKNYFFTGYENHLTESYNSTFFSTNVNSSQMLNSTRFDDEESKNFEVVKENINDFLKNIIASENHKIDQHLVYSAINSKSGRHYFSKLIFQKKFKQNKFQILSEKGFEDLYHLIFNFFIVSENEESQFNDIMRVTKSLFYYYKIVGKEQYYLYKEIVKKNNMPFSIWLNEDFWLRWFFIEIDERENMMNKMEDFYFFILSEIATMMNNLNLELKVVVNIIVHTIAGKVIIEDKQIIQDLEKTIVKQFRNLSREKDF